MTALQIPDLATEFTGKVALITGGGSGIGQAIARRLAAAGGHVAVLGRRRERLQETLDLIAADAAGSADAADATGAPPHAIAVTADVRDPEAIASAVAEVVSTLGQVDILVNNAAGNFVVPGEELSPRGWKAVIDIVLNGTFHCTAAVAQHMLQRGSGSILNVIATYAWHGHPGTVHSAAAKGGILAMTRTLAVEWADRGVRINCIAPGPTQTAGASAALWGDPDKRAQVLASVPAQRFLEPAEVAESAAYLLSDRADYVTGEALVVDGGQWLGKSIYRAAEDAPGSKK